jgi:polyhydroxyalkanoate synthesis regulator phasin
VGKFRKQAREQERQIEELKRQIADLERQLMVAGTSL